MIEDLIFYENFFSESDINFINQCSDAQPVREELSASGPFAGRLIGSYNHLDPDLKFIDWMESKLRPIFKKNFKISKAFRLRLHLPWDVHCDLFKNSCKPGWKPYYVIIIPLDNVPSRTVIFNQQADISNDFSVYKQSHEPVDDPVDLEFWNANLNFCWPDDRLYLSVKQVMPYQRIGQLHAIPRVYYHSSDNFHLRLNRPKSFVQVRIDTNEI